MFLGFGFLLERELNDAREFIRTLRESPSKFGGVQEFSPQVLRSPRRSPVVTRPEGEGRQFTVAASWPMGLDIEKPDFNCVSLLLTARVLHCAAEE